MCPTKQQEEQKEIRQYYYGAHVTVTPNKKSEL